MGSISIIGTGNMARALAGRALSGGNAVEIVGRDPVRAKELATALGGATVGTVGTAPAGDIVILAVPYASTAAVIGEYGDALDGKVVVDITNPITPISRGFLTPEGASSAQEIANRPPAHIRQGVQHVALRRSVGQPRRGPPVGRVHCRRRRASQKADVRTFIESLGMRPLDTGRLPWRGHWRTPPCCIWASSPTLSSTPTSPSASTLLS